MAQQVFPTKSNLMATKRSLALATQGYDLMDRKRNILVREMMQLIDRAAGIQDRISAAYAEAYEALKKANIMLGSVGGYAAGVPVERGVQMSTRSVMGAQLRELGVKSIRQVSRASDARKHLEAQTFDIVLCEQNFPQESITGQELLDDLRRGGMLPLATRA